MANEADERLSLAAEFDQPTRADWRSLVAGVLRKGGTLDDEQPAAPERLLSTYTYDGIELAPLYTAADESPETGFPGLPPFLRGSRPEGNLATGWDLRQAHDHPDPATTNKAILADLENSVHSLWLRVGANALRPDSLAEALSGVYVDMIPVVLDAGAEYEAAWDALRAVFAERDLPGSAVTGNLGADPVGLTARTGVSHELAPVAAFVTRLAEDYPRLAGFVADGLVVHEAGGSDAQELGSAIAAGVAYLRALTDAGMSVDAAAHRVQFRLAATADQFVTIAKFRAARRLWSRVTEVCGVSASVRGMHQHAVTSSAMVTRRDPWVNILRGTVACFGAAVGGADAITVLPFDDAIGLPDEFARRIARNTSSILFDESKCAGVIDPAGGSWYVENLTDSLARAAWGEFTEIERQGGIESTVDSGWLDARISSTRAARNEQLATRQQAITGVSAFPNLGEELPEREARRPCVGSSLLPRIRYAQDYEALRDRSDARLAETGYRPRIFLATLGQIAAHTARASFVENVFAAGGIEPINAGATDRVSDVVAAFAESGSSLACICGSDAAYGEMADEVAGALREAGASAVLLAGKPSTEYSNVTGFVFTGCDVLAILKETLDLLGVD